MISDVGGRGIDGASSQGVVEIEQDIAGLRTDCILRRVSLRHG
jgi:hypothetical protein